MATIDGTLESSLHDTFEHVKDAHELGLLLRHVVREAVLHHELLQLALRPPQLGHSDRLFLHESASCISSDVWEQQQHEKRPASRFCRPSLPACAARLRSMESTDATRPRARGAARARATARGERAERGQVAEAAAREAAAAAFW